MTRFREATRADVPAVAELLADDWIGGATPDSSGALAAYDEMVAEGRTRLIVGDDAGGIVACYQITVILGLSFTADRRAQIEGVRVRADRRGQGIGAALMTDAEARARAAGAGLMQFTSNAARIRARAFYERQGYVASHVGFKKLLGG